jgi:excisionase family DNA binding protein
MEGMARGPQHPFFEGTVAGLFFVFLTRGCPVMPSVPFRRMRVPHFRPRDKILTLREAAAQLAVSRHTAFIYAATGQLAARQIGRMFFVREKDVKTFLDERTSRAQRTSLARTRAREAFAAMHRKVR